MAVWTGEVLSLEIFGESHSPEMGALLKGMPAETGFSRRALQALLDRRRPAGVSGATERREEDVPYFAAGLKSCEGSADSAVCDGSPLKLVFTNTDVRPEDYEALAQIPRPGHADYTAYMKYSLRRMPSGGGAFSGRMTAALTAAGGICLQQLESRGIRTESRLEAVGGCHDVKAMEAALQAAQAEGDSLGALVSLRITGLPVGLGGPLFEGLEGRLAAMLFAIPAVKGVEFGEGFGAAALRGSENNDPFRWEKGRVVTDSNRCGGILGGISDGMPLELRLAFKPTPSVSLPQHSVNMATGENVILKLTGRHDTCVALRALPVVEAAAALVLYDAILGEMP